MLLATDAAAEGLNLQRALPRRRQLRAAVEPGAARAADRARRSHRAAPCRPCHHARGARHRRGPGHRQSRAAAGARRRDTRRTRPPRRVPLRPAVARRVIAPEEHDEDERPFAAPATIPLTTSPDESCRRAGAEAARHLERSRNAWPPASRVPVSSIRSSRSIPPGVVICLRDALSTEEGDVVATRLTVVPCRGPPGEAGERSGRACIAAGAVAAVRDSASRPGADAWIALVREAHATRVGRLLARERALAGRADTASQLQPGLFDSRVLDRANEAAAAQDALDAGASTPDRRADARRPAPSDVHPCCGADRVALRGISGALASADLPRGDRTTAAGNGAPARGARRRAADARSRKLGETRVRRAGRPRARGARISIHSSCPMRRRSS